MPIDRAHYHGWSGKLHSPWFACLSIVKVGLLQVFRRKSYWVVLALGFAQFLVFWSVIYAVNQTQLPAEARDRILNVFGFSAETSADQDNGYILFMERQNVVVMILLAFSGSLLVGSDFHSNSLPFYLSRRIDRRHYIVGKLLAVSALVALLTTLPALLLFLEYGMFSNSLGYWIENWRIPVAVLAYSLALCVVNSILLVTISAYLQRVVPITIAWSSLFVMLGRIAGFLRETTHDAHWNLLDPWRDIRYVGRLCFGTFPRSEERELAWWALAILASACAVAVVALVRRVRAVEIVA